MLQVVVAVDAARRAQVCVVSPWRSHLRVMAMRSRARRDGLAFIRGVRPGQASEENGSGSGSGSGRVGW